MAKQLNKTQRQFRVLANEVRPRQPVLRNTVVAFTVGGSISVVGQLLTDLFVALGMPAKEASAPAVAILILAGSVLTGLGVFDKIAQFAGAGVAVPVTGFANSVVSAALEFKREGYVLGVGAKMFSLAGSVITFGVVTAFIVGLISALI